jgi:hypothetical protein
MEVFFSKLINLLFHFKHLFVLQRLQIVFGNTINSYQNYKATENL